ncbi:TPA: hypothetical protein IAA87_06525 [Candidatus Avigastranaerophilus faecigallinarum]|nr:hypothetical protein [Candidatus Avigastranaerophilus faecigallinarum]
MDKDKILYINTEVKKNDEQNKEKARSLGVQTNPIIQKMLFFNLNNKKGKFKFKDLFR